MSPPRASDPTAVMGRRLGAWFIDVVLCALAGAVPALLLANAYALDRSSDGPEVEWVEGDLAVFVRDTVVVLRGTEVAVTAASLLLALLLVTVALPGRTGRSPGLLAADLRLVDREGNPPGVGRALVRTAFWVVDGLPGLPVVGYLTARRTRRHQRLGDLVAGTYVIDQRAADPDTPPTGTGTGSEVEVEVEAEAEPEPEVEPDRTGEDDTPVPGTQERPDPSPGGWEALAREGPTDPPRAPNGAPADKPVWDRRHRRYVLWHSGTERWMEFVDDAWRPVAGGGGAAEDTSGRPTG